MLSNYDDPGYVRAFLQFGTRGYLSNSATGEEIVSAVRAAARGGTMVLSESARAAPGAGGADLSGSELEVLELIAAGSRNVEITTALSIAESTVEYHVRHLLTKLGA